MTITIYMTLNQWTHFRIVANSAGEDDEEQFFFTANAKVEKKKKKDSLMISYP